MAKVKKKGRLGDPAAPSKADRKGKPKTGPQEALDLDKDLPEEEGEAGETVVFKRCPSCKRLYEDNDGHFCPSCHFDTRTCENASAKSHNNGALRYLPTYFSTFTTVFLAFFLIYFIIVPAPEGKKDIFSAGWLFLLLGISLLALAGTFFFALRRFRITGGAKTGLLLSGIIGISISSFLIGVFFPARFLMDLDNEVGWSNDNEVLHTAYLLFGFASLVFTVVLGYMAARKGPSEGPK